jgi:hypothetical protein
MDARVFAEQDGWIGPEVTLIVMRSVGESRTDYILSNAVAKLPLGEPIRAQRRWHRGNEVFEAGNDEAEHDQYESAVGSVGTT